MKTIPERIRAWVEKEFAPNSVETVFQEFLDVATGTREGNRFVRGALLRIFPGFGKDCGEGPWKTKRAAEDFARAEVGAPCVVRKGKGGWRVFCAPE